MRIAHRILLVIGLAVLGRTAFAQAYPAKPVKIVIPFSAGTGIDVIARILTEELREKTGLITVIDYKPGALGTIGTDYVARSPADGYTLMPSSAATHSSGPQIVRHSPYDPLKDFTHISNLISLDLLLMVNARDSLQSAREMMALGRSDPKALTYGYGSATSQTATSTVMHAMGAQALGVAYKGQPLAITDLLSQQVRMVTADIGAAMPHIKSGKLRALGILTERRSPIVPDVPTLAEQGINVALPGWVGLSGPANLPPDVVAWWSKHLAEALKNPEVVKRLRAAGFEPHPITGTQFQSYVVDQYSLWGRLVVQAGIEKQ